MRRLALGLALALAAPVPGPAWACADLQELFNPTVHVELADAVAERRFTGAERILATRSLEGLNAELGGALIQEVLRGHDVRQLSVQTVRLMKTLLSEGADPDAIRPGGYTPLMLVTGAPEDPELSVEIIEALVAAGADIDMRSNFAKTALMYAAREGSASAVETMLRLGADPALRDKDGRSAADMARRRGHKALADLLSQAERS